MKTVYREPRGAVAEDRDLGIKGTWEDENHHPTGSGAIPQETAQGDFVCPGEVWVGLLRVRGHRSL
jgi:hypothetical protein